MSVDVDTDKLIRAQLAEIRDSYPSDPDSALYASVADYFDLAGDQDRAIAAMARSVECAPDSARLHFVLARLLLKAERYREGGRELEVCSDIDSVELAGRRYCDNNLYYLGYALFNVGRYKEAAEAFRGAENLINIWVDPLVLKRFHLHQGHAWHLERQFLEAGESYRRGLIAPGPGDSCDEDVMDEDVVEQAQDFNAEIEPFLDLAQQGLPLEAEGLKVVPSFP